MLGMILCVGIHGRDVQFCGKAWDDVKFAGKVLEVEELGNQEQNGCRAFLALMPALFRPDFPS
jgi:hypothetical protein